MAGVPEAGSDVRFVPGAAVLFDSDGVLVDSDASVLLAWSQWAAQYGLEPGAVFEMVHGHRSADTVRTLLAAADVPGALAAVDALELAAASGVRAFAGARELLHAIAPARWAVVTSATTALALARLQAAQLPSPAYLVTADDVTMGKPAPDPYLVAALRVGQRPADVIVVEDSVNGIASARAAGAGAVIGIGERALAADPDYCVPGLSGVTWNGHGLLLDGSTLLA